MKTGYIIDAGVVVNAIVLEDAADPSEFGAVLGPEGAGIGWRLVDGDWFAPEPTLGEPTTSPLQPLSARQLRLGLLKIGIKPSQVDAAIAGLPEEQKEAAEIEWTYASQYQRDHYLIGLLAASFGLTEEAVDAAWRDAQAL